jgi:oxygen-independent coproporphyrinogen III oxidase
MPARTAVSPYAVRLPNMGKHLYPLPVCALRDGQLASHLDEAPPPGTRAQLYVHLPFCEHICTFCLIQKYRLAPHRPVGPYVDALKRELLAYSRLPYVRELRFDNVYFGGGTPSVLDDRLLGEIVELIHDRFTLDRPQITFEGNVQSLTRDKIRFVRGLGFNRLSAGVQTFDPELRKRLNLIPTEDDIRRCLEAGRDEGFADFNIDLMFNLPGQTLSIWERDLLKATGLAPSGLDVYETVVAQKTPLYRQLKRGELTLPRDPEELARSYLLAEELLSAHGYEQKNLYVWNRRGAENRLMDSQDDLRDQTLDIVGAGLSSYSCINGCSYSNEAGLSAYIERVRTHGHAAVSFYRPTREQLMKRFMIMSLQTFVLDGERFAATFRQDMDETFRRPLASLQRRGLVASTGSGYRLTRLGRAWASTMAVEFYDIPYLHDVMRGRLEKRIAVGLTREEEYDHILFTLFHPDVMIGDQAAALDVRLLRDYVGLLRRSDPGWSRELAALLREQARHYHHLPLRAHLAVGSKIVGARVTAHGRRMATNGRKGGRRSVQDSHDPAAGSFGRARSGVSRR